MIPLEARKIHKSFGRAEVLRGASIELRGGEVHVLAGENGAGKSTLIKILSGVHAEFEGELLLGGAPRRFADPLAARRAGVATIHQELSLVGPMSAADNLFLGREIVGRAGLVDRRRQREEARAILAAFQIDIDPDTAVEALPIATQQLLEIAKALRDDAQVLIFDEPTSALDDAESERLFSRIERLRGEGKAILFVSHRMEDIYRIGDRITVLRDGACVASAPAADLPQEALIRAMLGRDPPGAGAGAAESAAEAAEARPARIEVEGLSVPSLEVEGRLDVANVSFSLAPGEIVGLAGLRGAGASAVLEALYGARSGVTGRIAVDGRPARIHSPADALRHGIALLAGDRQRAGVVPAMSVVQNATLASLRRFGRGPWMREGAEREAVAALAGPLNLRGVALDAEMGTLSGGTQQKVGLARCLLAEPRVLLLDEPTRGVDVGAKADLHRLMRELAGDGAAVLFATSELTELLALADRVLVLYKGRMAAAIPRAGASRARILREAMGGEARV
jgi:ABC-type sugar transport system ATPase subunit